MRLVLKKIIAVTLCIAIGISCISCEAIGMRQNGRTGNPAKDRAKANRIWLEELDQILVIAEEKQDLEMVSNWYRLVDEKARARFDYSHNNQTMMQDRAIAAENRILKIKLDSLPMKFAGEKGAYARLKQSADFYWKTEKNFRVYRHTKAFREWKTEFVETRRVDLDAYCTLKYDDILQMDRDKIFNLKGALVRVS